MADAPEQDTHFRALRRLMTSPPEPVKYVVIVGAVVALAYLAIVWKTVLAPAGAESAVRYRSHVALMRLYALQLERHKSLGTFANDLDSLLAGAPDAEKVRAELKATTDINTLAVIGDAEKFRLEANILDSERTLVKFRGTAGDR